MKICDKCGSLVDNDSTFCKNCGEKITTVEKQNDNLNSNEPVKEESTVNYEIKTDSVTPTETPVPITNVTYTQPKKSKTPIIAIIVVIGIVAIIAIAVAVGSGSNNNDKIETNDCSLWEVGDGSTLKYTASGTYTNVYDSTSPHKVSAETTTTITSSISTSFVWKEDGKLTIDGLGDTPISNSQTFYRDTLKK